MVRWQKYSQKGLIFALFQHKNIRFFFTPLRVKKILETKKHKQIRLYNHILNIHPRLGQTTVGLVGNKTARNFIFIKIRILLKSYNSFYVQRQAKSLRLIAKKYTRFTSKFSGRFDALISFFDHKALHLLYTSGFLVRQSIAKFMVWRGFTYVNTFRIYNTYLNANVGDFISILPGPRNNLYEIFCEAYESFRKKYFSRLYKVPFFNKVSQFIA